LFEKEVSGILSKNQHELKKTSVSDDKAQETGYNTIIGKFLNKYIKSYKLTDKSGGNVTNEEPKTLKTLFKKTVAKPSLYYLPLSEEEVKEKLKILKLNCNK